MHNIKNTNILSLIKIPEINSGDFLFCEMDKSENIYSYNVVYNNNIIPYKFKLKLEESINEKSNFKPLNTSTGISLNFLNCINWNILEIEEYNNLLKIEQKKEKDKRDADDLEREKKNSEILLKNKEDLKSFDKIINDFYNLRKKYENICVARINPKIDDNRLFFYDKTISHLATSVDYYKKYFDSGSEVEIFCRPYFIENDIKIYTSYKIYLGCYICDIEENTQKEIYIKSFSQNKISLKDSLLEMNLNESIIDQILEYICNFENQK